METKLNYSFTTEQANALLDIVNRTQVSGVQGAKAILGLAELLQSPLNKEDIEKAQYEELKGKFEKK